MGHVLTKGSRLKGVGGNQEVTLGPLVTGHLQQTMTWYKIRHAGGQAHYYSRTGTLK